MRLLGCLLENPQDCNELGRNAQNMETDTYAGIMIIFLRILPTLL